VSKSESNRKERAVERGKRIFGIVMICVSLLALFSWEKFGRAHFYYEDILVLRRSVERGSIIKPEMLKTVKTERMQKDMLRPADRQKICGKAASQFVHAGSPLYKEYFCDKTVLTGRKYGKYRIGIPERWILSCPDDLRPGDRIYVLSEGRKVAEARVISYSEESKSIQAAVSGKYAAEMERAAVKNHGLVICSS
jgi:hypothetical protein